MTFVETYLSETKDILAALDTTAIEDCVDVIADIRDIGGRLFILGVGGSAANASHAVNDYRKICDVEAYALTENVAELTARTNDDGWASTFVNWLRTSRVDADDAIMVFSVGGGNDEASPNVVFAVDLAWDRQTAILGIVGRDGGHTAARATACVTVPPLYPDRTTGHTEGIAMVVHHLIVNHPRLIA